MGRRALVACLAIAGAFAGATATACGAPALDFVGDAGGVTGADAAGVMTPDGASAKDGSLDTAESADAADATPDAADAGPSPLAINEIAGNSPDYVELFNLTTQPIVLTGYSLIVGGTTVPLTKTVAASGYYVLALNGATCAAAPPCDAAPTVGISNAAGGETIKLVKGAALLEQVQYPGGVAAGMSWSRSPNGTGSFAAKPKSQGSANP